MTMVGAMSCRSATASAIASWPVIATTMRSGAAAIAASMSGAPAGHAFSTPAASAASAHCGKKSPFASVAVTVTGASIARSVPVVLTVVDRMFSGCSAISVVVPSAFSKVRGQSPELSEPDSSAGASLADASGSSDAPQPASASAPALRTAAASRVRRDR